MKNLTLKSRYVPPVLRSSLLLYASLMAMATAAIGMPSKTLHFGVHVSEMGSLDPHFAAGSQDRALADLVFNGLLRYQPGNAPVIEPDLAQAIPNFEMVDGRQVWTVKLRKGVWFHAGPGIAAYELTADDVVFSLNKSADPAFCAYAGEYEGLSLLVVDRYTLQIIVDKPLSATLFLPKLTNYAGGFIVSQRAIETLGYAGFKQHPVGTGPFVFSDYTPGDKLVLKANQRYFRGRPQLDGIEFSFVPEIDRREAGLRAGTLDVIMGSGEKGWPEKMAADPGVLIDTHGVGEVATLYLNSHVNPLDDIRVRRAIAFALDRRAFLNTVSRQFAGLVYSPVPVQFLPGGISLAEASQLYLVYDHDLERARQLMTAAGHSGGFALDLVSSEKRLYRTYYGEIKRQLAKINIDCRISIVSHSQMHHRIREKVLPMVIYVAWRPNADAYLSRFFHSDASIIVGSRPDTNFSQYSTIDPLIEAARVEINPNRQIQLWQQAQIRILDDMIAYPIMFTKQCYARRSWVEYGHPLISTMALYPQFTEQTRMTAVP